MTTDEDAPSLVAFFNQPEAIGLVARMDAESGNIKAEIEEKLDYSSKSVTRLLQNAQETGLIEEAGMYQGDHPRSTRYKLTDLGLEVQSWLHQFDIDELYREYLEAKQELDAAIPKVRAIVEEEIIAKTEQQDSWTRHSSSTEKTEREQLQQEPDEEPDSGPPESVSDDDDLVDVVDEDGDSGKDDLGRVETWGTEEDANEDD